MPVPDQRTTPEVQDNAHGESGPVANHDASAVDNNPSPVNHDPSPADHDEEGAGTGDYVIWARDPKDSHRHSNGRRQSDGMSPVKQATLINHHIAIEDSVDIDSIWTHMQPVLDGPEEREIQSQGTKKAKMKKLLDILPSKNDDAFDTLVQALKPDYRWLALRMQQGVKDEEARVNRMGKGVRRKIALALLTARISERQKDGILDRVTSVVETEVTQKANRVSIPDHRAMAQLDAQNKKLQDLMHNRLDPLLYGAEPTSARDTEAYDDAINALRGKLEELEVLKQCYGAFKVDKATSSGTLPTLLLDKIEEVKTRIKLLQQDQQQARNELERLKQEKAEQQRSIDALQQHNRNLEVENRTLESDRQWLEHSVRKNQDVRSSAEKDLQRAEEENVKLRSEVQQVHDRLSDLSLRNRSLDDQNAKLTRDNVKLTTATAKLRKEVQARGNGNLSEVRSENKLLASDKLRLRKDIQHMEAERRKLLIRTQKLEAENRNLRQQRLKLMEEKRKSLEDNKVLRAEAKRLALGKYSPLPPIKEDRPREDVSDDVSIASRSSENRRPLRRRARSTNRRLRSETPWNKYREDGKNKNKLPKGRGPSESRRKRKDPENDEVGADGEKVPGYMKKTLSSKKHHYLSDDGRGRRAIARK